MSESVPMTKAALEAAAAKPSLPIPKLNEVPVAMAQLPRWVAWDYVRKAGKWTKVPMNPKGGPGKSNDPSTWGTMAQALACAKKRGFAGVGFVFVKKDGFIGIDLDDCRDPVTGHLTVAAKRLLKGFRLTYAEVSPSATGVKVFARGALPPGAPKKRGWLEVYDSGRYFAVTGWRLPEHPPTLNRAADPDIPAALTLVFEAMQEKPTTVAAFAPAEEPELPAIAPPTMSPPVESFVPVAGLVMPPEVRRPAKIGMLKLWAGNWDAYPSQSEADLALLGMLAPYCDYNPETLDRWFRVCGLMRPKWDRVHTANGETYGQRCLAMTQGNAPAAAELVTSLAADVEIAQVDWLWPGWIAFGTLTVLDGDPGLGKSTLTAFIAARLSRGEPIDTRFAAPAAASMLLSAEDSAGHTIRPRLEAAGADLAKVRLAIEALDGYGGVRGVTLPEDIAAVEKQMIADGARLLVIDPLMAFLGKDRHGKAIDAHRDQSVRGLMSEFKRLAERTNAAVIVVRHLNKASGPAAVYRGGGSIGISGAARSVLCLGKHPLDPSRRVLAMVKCNLGPMPLSRELDLVGSPTPTIQFGCECDFAAEDLMQNPIPVMPASEPVTRIGDACDWLQNELANGERPAADLIRAGADLDYNERLLQRACRKMEVVVRREGRLAFWSLR